MFKTIIDKWGKLFLLIILLGAAIGLKVYLMNNTVEEIIKKKNDRIEMRKTEAEVAEQQRVDGIAAAEQQRVDAIAAADALAILEKRKLETYTRFGATNFGGTSATDDIDKAKKACSDTLDCEGAIQSASGIWSFVKIDPDGTLTYDDIQQGPLNRDMYTTAEIDDGLLPKDFVWKDDKRECATEPESYKGKNSCKNF